MLLSLGHLFLKTRGSFTPKALYVRLNWIFPCHTGNLIERSRTINRQFFVFLGIKVGAWWTLGHGSTIELQDQPNRQFLKYIHILKLRSANTHVDLLHSFAHPSGTSWDISSVFRETLLGGWLSLPEEGGSRSKLSRELLTPWVGDCHYSHTKTPEL